MTHTELCYLTAKRFIGENEIGLVEYQISGNDEHPDVLMYYGMHTNLYEIKLSRSDFLADKKKDCRFEYKVKYWARLKS